MDLGKLAYQDFDHIDCRIPLYPLQGGIGKVAYHLQIDQKHSVYEDIVLLYKIHAEIRQNSQNFPAMPARIAYILRHVSTT